jgi:hypothetical protein
MSPGKFQLTRDVLPRSFRRAKIWLTETTSVLPSHSRRRASKDTRKHRLRSGTRRMSTELNTHSVSHADRWPWRTALTLSAARGRADAQRKPHHYLYKSPPRKYIARALHLELPLVSTSLLPLRFSMLTLLFFTLSSSVSPTYADPDLRRTTEAKRTTIGAAHTVDGPQTSTKKLRESRSFGLCLRTRAWEARSWGKYGDFSARASTANAPLTASPAAELRWCAARRDPLTCPELLF